MSTLIVREGQSIFDICIWKYGTLNEISRLTTDNNVNYDGDVAQGDTMVFDPSLAIGNYQNKTFFERKKLIPVSFVENVREINNFVFKDGTNFIFKDGTNFIFKQ